MDRWIDIGCPYDLAVVVLPAAVGGGQRGRALLQVPGLASALGGAGDGDGVDGVGVAVARAVVPAAAAVARGPDEDGAAALPALTEEEEEESRERSNVRERRLLSVPVV